MNNDILKKLETFSEFFRYDNIRMVLYPDGSGHMEFDFYDGRGRVTIYMFNTLEEFFGCSPKNIHSYLLKDNNGVDNMMWGTRIG